MSTQLSRFILSIACAAAVAVTLQTSAAHADSTSEFNLPAQSLADSLRAVGDQTNINIFFDPKLVDGRQAPAVKAQLSLTQALNLLLKGTGLSAQFVDDKTITLVTADAAVKTTDVTGVAGLHLAQSLPGDETGTQNVHSSSLEGDGKGEDKKTELDKPDENSSKGISEVLVQGRRTLNADIRRTESDAQPYVVFDAEEIERSQAVDVESFLMSQLPMNTSRSMLSRDPGNATHNEGNIDLRGLGANQTLVLLDGRRLPSTVPPGGDLLQPNISGIPLSSIERIEVLPATASGIYGGGATGGVVNIIRKRDYSGVELRLTYGSTFRSDTEKSQFDLSGGLDINHGRGSLTFGASRSEMNPLLASDRNFLARSRALFLRNNPGTILALPLPNFGATTNICASAVTFYEGYGYYGECVRNALTLDSGISLNGASITNVPAGYAGPASDSGAALAAGAGFYNLDPPPNRSYLLRAPTKDSGFLSFRYDIGKPITAYLDVSRFRNRSDLSTQTSAAFYGALPADDPLNPFEQDIAYSIAVPSSEWPATSTLSTGQIVGGVMMRLPHAWTGALEHSRSTSELSSTQTVNARVTTAGFFRLQTLALQDMNAYPADLSGETLPAPDTFLGPIETALVSNTLRVSGPALDLPAGSLMVTGFAEFRRESVSDGYKEAVSFSETGDPSSAFTWYPHRHRDQKSYYVEGQIPVIGSSMGITGINSLDATVSVRRDAYETVSTIVQPTASSPEGPFITPTYTRNDLTSTDYTAAMRYSPVESLVLRASYGTGFLPAGLSYLQPVEYPVVFPGAGNGVDPRRGNTFVSVPRTIIGAGNPRLKPETSKSWSAGFIVQTVSGLRFSVDLVDIQKSDEIYIPSQDEILALEMEFPGRVTRGPKLVSDPVDWAGPITKVDQSAINLSGTRSRSLDFQIDYKKLLDDLGTLHLAMVATRMLRLGRQLTPLSSPFDLVGFSDGPLEWRAQTSLSLERNDWFVGWNVQFYDTYSIELGFPAAGFQNPDRIRNQGATSIPSQVYHDFFVRYTLPDAGSRLFSGIQIAFGIQNVFDKSPPILTPPLGLDDVVSPNYSPYGDPSLRRFSLSVRKSFGR